MCFINLESVIQSELLQKKELRCNSFFSRQWHLLKVKFLELQQGKSSLVRTRSVNLAFNCLHSSPPVCHQSPCKQMDTDPTAEDWRSVRDGFDKSRLSKIIFFLVITSVWILQRATAFYTGHHEQVKEVKQWYLLLISLDGKNHLFNTSHTYNFLQHFQGIKYCHSSKDCCTTYTNRKPHAYWVIFLLISNSFSWPKQDFSSGFTP